MRYTNPRLLYFRREGANRAQREVDDMFTMITSLDELLLLSKLPTYVTDNADKIPSTRLYEGDFSVIMNILEKMDGKHSNFGSALSAISRDVCALQSKSSSTEAKVGGVIPKKVTAGLELNIDRIGLNDWPALPSCSAGAPVMTSYGNPSALPSVDSAHKEVTNTNTVIASTSGVSVGMSKATDGYLSSLQEKQWSVLASTPVATDNRFAVLASTDDENHDDRPFVLPRQRSGRSAGKRSRQLSAAKGGQQINRVPEGQHSQIQSSGRQKSRLVTGQSAAATLGLWAAKKAVKKAVFCVDNVGLACNEDEFVHTFPTWEFKFLLVSRLNPDVAPTNQLMMLKTERHSDCVLTRLIGTVYSTLMFGLNQFVFLTGFLSETRRIKLLMLRSDDVLTSPLNLQLMKFLHKILLGLAIVGVKPVLQ